MSSGGGGGFMQQAVNIGTLGAVNPGGRGWLGDISGANQAADAAQAAAMAQQQMAMQTRGQVLTASRGLESDVNTLSQAGPRELAALGRSYDAASQQLSRQEQLMQSIDPALMEASKQALNLLRGQTADINKPMTDQRNSQRQQLVNSLRSQYGPAAESTSIGQKALQNFDMQTNSMFAQNQQNALAQTYGIATSDPGRGLRADLASLQGVGQGYGALAERRLNARMNVGNTTLGALSGTSQQLIQSAGAPYVGAALQAQGQQALFNQAVGVGGMALGNYMGGAGYASGMKAQQPQQVQPNMAGQGYGNYGAYT